MTGLRPFWAYYGGKWRAAPLYPKPLFDTIIEPFAGAAGYSLRYPDRKVVLVEKNPKVAATWRYLLRVSAAEVRALPDLGADQTVNDLAIVEEARLLIGWWINKGTAAPRIRASSNMRRAVAGLEPCDPPSSWWGPQIRERIAWQVDRIRHWRLIEGDYTDAPDVDATWFIDPPYIGAGKHYPTQPADFGALGTWCQTRRGQVMVCENVGAMWLPFQPFITIRANASKNGGKVSHEALWTNGGTA